MQLHELEVQVEVTMHHHQQHHAKRKPVCW